MATLVTGADAVSITANAGDITFVGAITATAGTLGVTATAGSINDAADDNTADFTGRFDHFDCPGRDWCIGVRI